MAIKKSQLYSSIWKSCDELRGGMDASQYKDYVLVLLFIKYISDKYAGVTYARSPSLKVQVLKIWLRLRAKPLLAMILTKKLSKIAEANHLLGILP